MALSASRHKRAGPVDTPPRELRDVVRKIAKGSDEEIGRPPTDARKDKAWFLVGRKLIRVRRKGRVHTFKPDEHNCPMPMKCMSPTMTTRRWVKSAVGYRDESTGLDCVAAAAEEIWVGDSIFDLAEAPNEAYPAMPVRVGLSPHRRKRCDLPPTSATVARTAPKAELKACGRGMDSMKKEWDKLVRQD